MSISNLSRATGIAIPVSRRKPYRDINLRAPVHPVNGDVGKAVDLEAIKGSVRNLILTRRYERPFRPDIGSTLDGYLFEHADYITIQLFEKEIKEMVERFEPRVEVNEIETDLQPDRNSMVLSISMSVVDLNEQISVTVALERLR